MKNSDIPTASDLLKTSVLKSRPHVRVLMLLGLLCGIISSILFAPASTVLDAILMAIETDDPTGPSSQQIQQAMDIINAGLTSLIIGHIAVTVVSVGALVPWARMTFVGALPMQGGLQMFLRRTWRAFLHMIAANGVMLMVVMFVTLTILPVATLFGSAGNTFVFIGAILTLWALMAVAAIANVAVALEASDAPITPIMVWRIAKQHVKALTVSYAAIIIVLSLLNITLFASVIDLLPTSLQTTVFAVVGSTIVYLFNALHIAGLSAMTLKIS